MSEMVGVIFIGLCRLPPHKSKLLPSCMAERSASHKKVSIVVHPLHLRCPLRAGVSSDDLTHCPERFLGAVIEQDPHVSKSNRLHVDIFQFFFANVRYIPLIPLKRSLMFLAAGVFADDLILCLERFLGTVIGHDPYVSKSSRSHLPVFLC